MNKGLIFYSNVPCTRVAWQYSSFADGLDGKSRTGYVVLVCGSSVAWGSRLQPTVALSTMEAEYMALYVATQEVMFLRQLLTELSLVLNHPTSMMKDNKGYISYAKNSMITSKSNYINVNMHFVRDTIRDNIIVVQREAHHSAPPSSPATSPH
jgi:hypothetical protein